jgi:hypothetical protein
MIHDLRERTLLAAVLAIGPVLSAQAQVQLIAESSISGTYQDLSDSTGGLLENRVPGNRLGGIGSAIAYARRHLPDAAGPGSQWRERLRWRPDRRHGLLYQPL